MSRTEIVETSRTTTERTIVLTMVLTFRLRQIRGELLERPAEAHPHAVVAGVEGGAFRRGRVVRRPADGSVVLPFRSVKVVVLRTSSGQSGFIGWRVVPRSASEKETM